jgi:hypothetical protein
MSRVKKTAATELHGPAAALIDKWRSAVGTASNADSVVSVSRASDGEPPGKRLKVNVLQVPSSRFLVANDLAWPSMVQYGPI